jgi:hypothetical protein
MRSDEAISLVVKVLEDVSFVSNVYIEEKTADKNVLSKIVPDYLLIVELANGEKHELNCEILKNAYPSTIRKKLEMIKPFEKNSYTVFAAPFVSAETMEMLKYKSAGFVDYAGNCYIDFKNLHISIQGNKNENISKRGMKSIFEKTSVVSSRILRLLFEDINMVWKLQNISKELDCSIGQVYKVKEFLEKNDWIEFDSNGIKITKPREILYDWAKTYSKSETEYHDFFSYHTPSEIESQFASLIKTDYYLTGYSGGARYSPSVRYNKVHVYIIPGKIREISDKLELKKVTSGANVSIAIPYDDCVLYAARKINEVNVISPIQAYLDCSYLKGRGEELAESILNKVITR